MAKNLSKLLKAQMPSSSKISDIAELVRRHGRGRDTVLAHITPKEAALLKARGGRGSRNPHTGLLEFDDGFDFSGFMDTTPVAQQPATFTTPTYTPDLVTQPATNYTGPDYTSGLTDTSQMFQGGNLYQVPTYNTFQQSYQAQPYTASFAPTPTDYNVAGSLPGQYATNVIDGRSLLIKSPDYSGLPPKSDARIINPAPVQTDVGAGITTSPSLVTPSSQYAGGSPDQSSADELQQYNQNTNQSLTWDQYQQKLQNLSGTQAQADQETQGAYGPTPPVNVGGGGGVGGGNQNLQVAGDAASLAAKGQYGAAVQSLEQNLGMSPQTITQNQGQINTLMTALQNGSMNIGQVQTALQQMANNGTFTGSLTNWLSQPGNDLKLAIGLGGALFGALTYTNAQAQAKNVQAQIIAAANAASAQQQQLAQPFVQAGGTQLAQALQGQLSPANIQALQAMQAQAAQANAQTGSVGAAQTNRAISDYTQQLLAAQQTAALNILGTGNQYLNDAISTQLSGTMQGLQTGLGIQQSANAAIANMAQALGKAFV
jgi:hypothetical protein